MTAFQDRRIDEMNRSRTYCRLRGFSRELTSDFLMLVARGYRVAPTVEQLHELIEQDVESCQPRHQLSTMIQREFGGDNDV